MEEAEALRRIRKLTTKLSKAIPLQEVLNAGVDLDMIHHLLKVGEIYEPKRNLIQILE